MGRVLVVLFKLIAVAIAIALPVLGAWLSSSLAAYSNGEVWVAALIGLLLFPIVPLVWDGVATLWRRHKKPGRERILTLFDRLVLRTLVLNLVFLGAMLAFFPAAGFRALATRGDWMLDGRTGSSAEWVRGRLFGLAEQLEWLYQRTHDDPLGEVVADTSGDDDPQPEPTPSPEPTPTPTPDGKPDVAPDPSPGPARSSAPWPVPPAVHPAVAAIPPGVETDYASVARYLAGVEPDPRQRIKALHDYVAIRIAYDAPALARGEFPPQDAETVFKTRLAVCAGYANLLEAMAKVTGDEVVTVVGDARFAADTIDGMGHAWNAAKIGSEWFLIDATWDAGSVEGATFTRRYGTDYLFTPPDYFGLNHLPEQDRWQLRDKPMTRGEFMRQPLLRPEFFRYGLKLRSPDRSQVTVDRRIDIVVEVPDGVSLMAAYQPLEGSDSERRECEVRGGSTTRITCEFDKPGRYAAWLFAAHDGQSVHEGVGHIEVNAR